MRFVSSSTRRSTAALIVVVAFWGPRRTHAAPGLSQPTTHIADYAHVIPADTANRLDGWLTELEQKTTAQVVVLTIASLGGEPIELFTIELLAQWKLGRKGRDNGVLICVAVKDRKYRIEVGYGLEGALPDSWCGSVARESFVPNFRRGDFGTGIYEGALAVANKVAQEYHASISGMPARTVSVQRSRGRRSGLPVVLLIIFIVLMLRRSAGGRGRYRRRGGFWGGWALGNMSGGWSSGGSSGWSSGGSFGGGGGGSFGGGGASGGW